MLIYADVRQVSFLTTLLAVWKPLHVKTASIDFVFATLKAEEQAENMAYFYLLKYLQWTCTLRNAELRPLKNKNWFKMHPIWDGTQGKCYISALSANTVSAQCICKLTVKNIIHQDE